MGVTVNLLIPTLATPFIILSLFLLVIPLLNNWGLFVPQMALTNCSMLFHRSQKSLDFQGPTGPLPLTLALEMDLLASKTLRIRGV